jgi:hypothetical protein
MKSLFDAELEKKKVKGTGVDGRHEVKCLLGEPRACLSHESGAPIYVSELEDRLDMNLVGR